MLTIGDFQAHPGTCRYAPGFRALVAALLLLCSGLGPAVALAAPPWWNADWQYRKGIAIRLPTPDTGSPPAVVLPIRLHAGNFQYFQDLQPSGADVRFVAEDGTPLKYQLEMLDPSAGLLVAWVEVAARGGAREQKIWMYYGNAHASAPDATALYDPDQVLVLHFAESQGPPHDGTAYHNDATASSAQAGVPGVIGTGARFDGHSAVRIAARPGLSLGAAGALTFSAWVQLDADTPHAVLYLQEQNDRRVEIGIASSRLYAEVASGDHSRRVESSSTVAAHAWHHVAASIGAGVVALYLDGAPAGNATAVAIPELSGDVLIGGRGSGDQADGLAGVLDEVGISRVARTAWWIRVNALGASPDSTLVAYAGDESRGAASKLAAYFAMMSNLLGQVSLDGLVVITITALMGLASLRVFISKAALLGRVERHDARFQSEFKQRFTHDIAAVRQATADGAHAANAGEPASAGQGNVADECAASGLYAMHRAGLRGLEAALEASGRAQGALRVSAEGFEAVRAALDAELVEATNRLNAGLVTMTVAIAGAPFLGLLGTVVGVMITFASIAAAGDVNVNTIAPGVAAAMTATVVGLLVAIPSLFGYNWLATRIGRRTSAMEVFADQFVSTLALASMAERESTAMIPERATGRAGHAA